VDEGAALTGEAETVSAAIGTQLSAYGTVALAALQGREAETAELIAATLDDVESRGEGMGVGISHFTAALLYNGLGRYAEALAEAEQACEHEDLGVISWALTELIEAAARCGRHEVATDALERLSVTTEAAGTDWALGVHARSRALVSEDEAADALHREAIARLSRTRVRVELTAYEMLSEMGVEAFAERARRELAATGETARKRVDETRDELTAQEAQIARLARDGLSNPEIGAELFISPRTVKYHLRKVFTKLGINSRHELVTALPETSRAAVAP